MTQPRRRGWFVRVLSWPVSLVIIIAGVAAGDQILRHTPGSEEVSRPFVHSGRIGEAVDGRTFTVTVGDVRGARSIEESDGDRLTSDGLFVLVTVTITAKSDTTSLSHLAVAHGDVVFWATERVRQRMAEYEFQPGIPVKGEIAFEVPRAVATGLVLRLSSDQVLKGENRNQTVAEIPLPVDQGRLTGWLAETEPLTVTVPEVS
jgi:hypothetical protein